MTENVFQSRDLRAKPVGKSVIGRVKKVETSLAKLGRRGIVLSDGVEKGEERRLALQSKHS